MKKVVFTGKTMEFTQQNGRTKPLSGEFEVLDRTEHVAIIRQGNMKFAVPAEVFRENFKEV